MHLTKTALGVLICIALVFRLALPAANAIANRYGKPYGEQSRKGILAVTFFVLLLFSLTVGISFALVD